MPTFVCDEGERAVGEKIAVSRNFSRHSSYHFKVLDLHPATVKADCLSPEINRHTMPICRASEQTRNTLRGHYEGLASGDHPEAAEAGRLMLQLIGRMEDSFREMPVWGLTSHYHLKLLAADDSGTPWLVSISPPKAGAFCIDYQVPAAEAPWPEARVQGEAHGVDAALEMIRTAMRRSGGWAPS